MRGFEIVQQQHCNTMSQKLGSTVKGDLSRSALTNWHNMGYLSLRLVPELAEQLE